MKYISTYVFCFFAFIAFSQESSYICHYDEVEIFSLDNINTKSIEFSPVFYQKGIVYVVAREKNKVLDPKTGRAYFDLMYTDIFNPPRPSNWHNLNNIAILELEKNKVLNPKD